MKTEVQSSEVFAFVPSYNHAPFIGECLRSIFAQTLAPRKLLVIDDGSRDDSPRVIEKLLNECPFEAELIVRENRGLCRTLNEGLARSSGDYFAYIGSDDYWLPDFFAARAALLNRRPQAVIGYGHAHFVDGNGHIFDNTANYVNDWADYPDGDAAPMLLRGIAPISSTVFYRRAALDEVRWNEDSRLEDYEMYLKMMTRGEFAFDPQILSVWRHHSYNTSKNLNLMMDEVIDAQNRNFDLLGVDREALAAIQTKTRFRYARDFLQHGEKAKAVALGRANWRGADSALQLGKFGLRLLVPMFVVDGWRKLSKGKQNETD